MEHSEKKRTKKFEITKKRILDAAQGLAMRNGFKSVTVKEVCEAADVSVGSFYNCFASLSEMLQEADNVSDRHFAIQSVEDLQGTNSAEKLLGFACKYAELNISTGVEDLSLLMAPSPNNTQYLRHKPMFDVVLALFQAGQDSGEFTKDYTAEQMCDMMFVSMRGCAYDWCMKNGQYDLIEKTLLHVNILLHALRKF